MVILSAWVLVSLNATTPAMNGDFGQVFYGRVYDVDANLKTAFIFPGALPVVPRARRMISAATLNTTM